MLKNKISPKKKLAYTEAMAQKQSFGQTERTVTQMNIVAKCPSMSILLFLI